MGKMNKLVLVATVFLATVAIHASLGFPGLKRVAAEVCTELIPCNLVWPPSDCPADCTTPGRVPHCGLRIVGIPEPLWERPTSNGYVDIEEEEGAAQVICYTTYWCAQSVDRCPTDPDQWQCLGNGYYYMSYNVFTPAEWANEGTLACFD